jgi:hypothetical protein
LTPTWPFTVVAGVPGTAAPGSTYGKIWIGRPASGGVAGHTDSVLFQRLCGVRQFPARK